MGIPVDTGSSLGLEDRTGKITSGGFGMDDVFSFEVSTGITTAGQGGIDVFFGEDVGVIFFTGAGTGGIPVGIGWGSLGSSDRIFSVNKGREPFIISSFG